MRLSTFCGLHRDTEQLGSFDHASELEARPFFFLNYKGTPSQEEHITIICGLRNDDTALSGWIDSSAFYLLVKITRISSTPEYDNPLSPLPHKMALSHHVLEIDFPVLIDCGKSI